MILSDIIKRISLVIGFVGAIGVLRLLWSIGPDIYSKFTPIEIRILFWVCVVATCFGCFVDIFV